MDIILKLKKKGYVVTRSFLPKQIDLANEYIKKLKDNKKIPDMNFVLVLDDEIHKKLTILEKE